MASKSKAADVTDIHRSVSISLLNSVSCFAVRTPRGQKDPGPINWDPRSNSAERSRENIDTIRKTDDNLGIHLFGTTIDVDIDSDNPLFMAALDWFLPDTPHVWGRKSRPRTHRLYELGGMDADFNPEEYPFLEKLQAVDSIALEVRGGSQRAGRYSLLPGSVHPSGEKYEWEDVSRAKSTPVITSVYKVMDGVRFACVAGLIAPYWTEGVRNQLCMALSGFMFRAAQYSEELAADLTFDRDQARALLEGIMEIADDDPADYPMRFKTFDQTWDKGEAGEAIAGATRVGEIMGDPSVVPLLYALLAHTPEMQELDAMFDQYAVLRNTASVVDLDIGAAGNYVMNKEAFVFTLAGRYITTPRGKAPISALFLNSLRRSIVDEVSIHPDEPKIFMREGKRFANIWSGWGIQPYEGEVDPREVASFIDYIENVVSSGDEKLAKWVTQWLADIFQNPASKPGTALVLVGAQGAGKSVLSENVLRPIIGDAHFAKVGSVEKLAAKFNRHMSGKLMIQGEEVISSKRKQDANTLKDAITSAKRSIEMKGRDVFEMDDFARYMFTSNHRDDAVAIETGDRRYTIVEVSGKYAFHGGVGRKERDDYWARFFGDLEVSRGRPNKEYLAKIHKYLLQVQVDRPFIMSAYDTEIKRRTQQNSSRGFDNWLLSLIEMTNPMDNLSDSERGYEYGFSYQGNKLLPTREWPEYVSYSLLEIAMRKSVSRDYGENRTAQQIAAYFKKEGMVDSTDRVGTRSEGRSIKVRPFPTRERIASYLEMRGYIVDKDAEIEQEEDDAEF